MLIYYTKQVLQGAEKRYQTIEKLALALINSSIRLRQYFQSHQIIVKTDHPLKQMHRKLELTGRMVAWSIEVSKFSLQFEP